MTPKDIIQKKFAYNYWANERILEKADLVSEADFLSPSVVEGRSLQQVLAHLVRTEKVWRLLASAGKVNPEQLPGEADLGSVKAIKSLGLQEREKMQAYLDTLDNSSLAEELQITRWDGVQMTMIRWEMLVHLALHSMQHRSEAAVLLTQYGQSPGNLDFLFFVL